MRARLEIYGAILAIIGMMKIAMTMIRKRKSKVRKSKVRNIRTPKFWQV